MGALTERENAWLDKATAAAVAGARKIASSSGPLMNTPVGRLGDDQWGWIVAAVIFGWIEVRVEQAIAEGLDQEQTVRLTGLSPSPCDVAVVRSILPTLADTAAIDLDPAAGSLVEGHDERLPAGRLEPDPQSRDRPRSWTGRDSPEINRS